MLKQIVNVLLVIGIIITIIGVGIKMKELKEMTIKRNEATKEIQEEVSKYLIENYEGITKIEWLGWKVEPMGNTATRMILNGFTPKKFADYFNYTVGDILDSETIINKTDRIIAISGPQNLMQEFLKEQGVKKSDEGSKTAEILYNWKENKGVEWKKIV